jgi:DNA-binding response OmpR family regulator
LQHNAVFHDYGIRIDFFSEQPTPRRYTTLFLLNRHHANLDMGWVMVVEMALSPKILFISDGQTNMLSALQFLKQYLQVVLEFRPAQAFQRWIDEAPDLIVIDIEPVESLTLSMVKQLREQAVIPILMVGSNASNQFMLEAYEAGADEYILKPVEQSLLYAKVKAWLRRTWSIPIGMLDALKVGDIRFLPAERTLILEGQPPIRMTNLELRLMYYLMSHAGRTITAEELCQRVWGTDREVTKSTLKNVVYRLRLKLEPDPTNPHYIRTVGGGYQFTPE